MGLSLFSFVVLCLVPAILPVASSGNRQQVQVMFFTYTDKDGFVPPSETDTHLTTGGGGVFSQLEEAVVNMPRKAAAFSAAPGGGVRSARREVRGIGASAGNLGLSETASVMQAHLAREDNFKARITEERVHIAAAVDVTVGGGNGCLVLGGDLATAVNAGRRAAEPNSCIGGTTSLMPS